MTDDEVIRQLSSENGYKLLFDKYYNYVYTIVYQIIGSKGSMNDIEECVSDALSDAAVFYDTKHGGSLKSYIGMTARNKAINMSGRLYRKSARTMPIDDKITNELASDDNVEENIEKHEFEKMILEKIKELGSPDSDIIIHKYFFDRNSTEIAHILKMNPITVRSRCKRAIKRLKNALSDFDITL